MRKNTKKLCFIFLFIAILFLNTGCVDNVLSDIPIENFEIIDELEDDYYYGAGYYTFTEEYIELLNSLCSEEDIVTYTYTIIDNDHFTYYYEVEGCSQYTNENNEVLSSYFYDECSDNELILYTDYYTHAYYLSDTDKNGVPRELESFVEYQVNRYEDALYYFNLERYDSYNNIVNSIINNPIGTLVFK